MTTGVLLSTGMTSHSQPRIPHLHPSEIPGPCCGTGTWSLKILGSDVSPDLTEQQESPLQRNTLLAAPHAEHKDGEVTRGGAGSVLKIPEKQKGDHSQV